MASSLGSLVVRLGLDASDYTTALVKAEATAKRFAGSTEQTMRSATRSTNALTQSVGFLKNAFVGVAASFGVRELVRLSDEYQTANARLSIFTNSQEQLVALQGKLFNVSQNTRQTLSGTTDLYYQLANATQDVGTSQGDLLKITEGVNKALIISGSSGSSAKGAIQQLSQALAANLLRGQEFNTINEQGNRIMRALGEGLGKTVDELRKMANAGLITTDVFNRGFLKGLASINKEFENIPITVGQALTVAENYLQRFIGTTFQTAGSSNILARSIIVLAKNIDVVTAAAIGFGTAKLASALITAVVRTEASVIATLKDAAATAANTAATVASTQAELARVSATTAAIVTARAKTVAELVATNATIASTVALRTQAAQAIIFADVQAGIAIRTRATSLAEIAAINASTAAHKISLAAKIAIYDAEIVASRVKTSALIADLALLGRAQAGSIAAAAAAAAGTSAAITGTAAAAAGAASVTAASNAAGVALGVATAATVGYAGAAAKATIASRLLGAAQTFGAGAAAIAGSAMRALGGPIGAVATALGLGVTAWQIWSSRSSQAAADAALNVETSTADMIRSIEKSNIKLRERLALIRGTNGEVFKATDPRLDRAADLLAQANTLTKSGDRSDRVAAIDKEADANELIKRYQTQLGLQKDITFENQKLSAADWMEKYAKQGEKLNAELAKAKKELGAAFTPELEKRIREKFAEKGGGRGSRAGSDGTKKTIDGELKLIEASIAKERDILVAHENFLSDNYSRGFISVKDYYDQLESARADNVKSVLRHIDLEIEAERRRKESAKTPVDRQDAQNKIDDKIARKENIQRDALFAEEAITRQRDRANADYVITLSEINAKILEISGNTAEAAAIRFDASNSGLSALLKSSGSTEAQAQLALLREHAILQGRINDKTKEYTVALGYVDLAESRINLERSSGAITEIEALVKTSALYREKLAGLKAIAAQNLILAQQSKDPSEILKAEQIILSLEKMAAATDLLKDKFNEIFSGAFSDAIQALVGGTKSFKEAVADMAKSITASISKIAADSLATKLFGKEGPLSGAGDLFSTLFGGAKDAAGGAANAATATALAGSATALTGSGTLLTSSGTVLATSGATLSGAGTILATSGAALSGAGASLLGASAALTAAATALTASSATSAAGGIAGAVGNFAGYAQGGGLAGGTEYWKGGPTWIGEGGPEVLNLPRGSRVTPANEAMYDMNKNQSKLPPMIFNLSVMPGATTHSTRQAGNILRDAVLGAVRER